jgi:hypothetical protein
MDELILKRAWRSSGKWDDDDYNVVADGVSSVASSMGVAS